MVQTRMRNIEKRVTRALARVAAEAVPMIRRRAPKAFGDLQGSVHAELADNPKTVVDAPHAGAVEKGSPPHTPDMDKLLAWVKLRGRQGLTNRGSLRQRFPRIEMGLTTPGHAKRVAKALKRLEVRASRRKVDPHGRFMPVDAAMKVTEAIAKTIEKRGTRPQFFVRNSLPEIAANMGRQVRKAVKQ